MTSAVLLGLVLAATDPPADADVRKRAEALVRQLGDADYRDRERAAKELLAIGYPAKDAVLTGQKSPDQEVSDRCTKLYPLIWRHDLDKRVQRFLDNPDGPLPDDLPGLARWLRIAGDGKASRELYAETVKAHLEPLLEIELHPDRVATAYEEHVRTVFDRVNQPRTAATAGRPTPSESEVLLFLFLGAVGDVRTSLPPGTMSSFFYRFLSSTSLTVKLASGEAGAPVRRLLAAWLEKERYSVLVRRGVDLAAQYKVTECLPTALKIASDRGVVAAYRASALLAVGKIGTRENLKDLSPFLADKTQIGGVNVNGEVWTVQVRDVALGAAVQLVGESPSDFGFERRPPSNLASVSSYAYYAFPADEKREAAHRKWGEWAAEHLKK